MWWFGSCAAASALVTAGCAPSKSTHAGREPVSAGLSSLAPSVEPEADTSPDKVGQMLADSERLFDDLFAIQKTPPSTNPPDRSAGTPQATPTPPPADTASVAQAEPEIDLAADAPPESPPAPSPADRTRTLGAELAAVLREAGQGDPMALAVRLAALQAAQGGPVAGLDRLIEGLPVDQRDAARALAAVLAAGDADPRTLADILAAESERLAEARPLSIRTAALCSRVEGFGRYTPLASSTFVAGSPMRMVIYVELDHFNHTPISGSGSLGESDTGDAWEVRLSQELQLYHESDGLLAWRQPEEVTVYRTRSRVRDYFVVNPIELPRTLTVGAYRLKIVMRDLSDRSVDERIVPVRVVADGRLVP